MMGLLTSRLAGPIAAGLSLILSLSLAFVWITKSAEVRVLTKANSTLSSDLAQSRLNASRLEGSLATQSAAIATLAAAGAQRELRLADAISIAERASTAAQSASERILAAKPVGNVCEAANRLILSEAGR